MQVNNFYVFLTLLFHILWGCLSAHFANKKNRNIYIWGVIGTCFGIFGALLILIMPIKKPLENSDKTESPESLLLREDAIETNHSHTTDDTIWFYLNDDKTNQGPMSKHNLIKILNSIENKAEKFIWRKGMNAWEKVKNVKEINQE